MDDTDDTDEGAAREAIVAGYRALDASGPMPG